MASMNPQSSAVATAPALARRVVAFQENSLCTESAEKHAGYGLPCANCKTYYTADLTVCPVCKSPQRVSPVAALHKTAPAEQLPDPKQIEAERERFMSDLNGQIVATPLAPEQASPAAHCTRPEKHLSSPVPATVCQSCFDELQQRVDVLEAALHIDMREAAQIIYDAVWADTSDPGKTYQNAAQALLIELRRRSALTHDYGHLRPPLN
ncbi:MAG TPA: hypothetical protein VFA90_00690 [Terriglobales bacterium]|nr:hypothetical protein [Terriglobales bacterium]